MFRKNGCDAPPLRYYLKKVLRDRGVSRTGPLRLSCEHDRMWRMRLSELVFFIASHEVENLLRDKKVSST